MTQSGCAILKRRMGGNGGRNLAAQRSKQLFWNQESVPWASILPEFSRIKRTAALLLLHLQTAFTWVCWAPSCQAVWCVLPDQGPPGPPASLCHAATSWDELHLLSSAQFLSSDLSCNRWSRIEHSAISSPCETALAVRNVWKIKTPKRRFSNQSHCTKELESSTCFGVFHVLKEGRRRRILTSAVRTGDVDEKGSWHPRLSSLRSCMVRSLILGGFVLPLHPSGATLYGCKKGRKSHSAYKT